MKGFKIRKGLVIRCLQKWSCHQLGLESTVMSSLLASVAYRLRRKEERAKAEKSVQSCLIDLEKEEQSVF